LGGTTGFLGSGLTNTGGGGTTGLGSSFFSGVFNTGFLGSSLRTGLPAATGTAGLAGPDTGGWAGCDFGTGLEVLGILGTTDFLAGMFAGFFAGVTEATFFTTGLAILLDTGAFLAVLAGPDEWTGFATAFLAGTIFLTLVGFLAGFAAFFLVAIVLGFFSNKHL
jgi:hypothetical protein